MARCMRLDWAFRSLRRMLKRNSLADARGSEMYAGLLALALSFGCLQAQDFVSIFDGQTLNGWDGDAKLWRVEDGALTGQTTPTSIPKQNSFVIWRGGHPADFELKLEYRLTGGNSGIQYRSSELPDIRWAMRGYQADIDAEQRFTGQIYEERGRGFLALRGQFVSLEPGRKPSVLGSLGEDAVLKNLIRAPGWNDYDIVARGNVLIQILNGRVMSGLTDDDVANRKMEGLIGIQLHTGEPMKIEVRNIRLKNLTDGR